MDLYLSILKILVDAYISFLTWHICNVMLSMYLNPMPRRGMCEVSLHFPMRLHDLMLRNRGIHFRYSDLKKSLHFIEIKHESYSWNNVLTRFDPGTCSRETRRRWADTFSPFRLKSTCYTITQSVTYFWMGVINLSDASSALVRKDYKVMGLNARFNSEW
jgi:hypothetical protein